MATPLDDFVREQSKQYQYHLTARNKARQVLQHQKNIRSYKTIPRHYLPQKPLQLIQPTTALISDYQQKFRDLFFQHLNDVISSNTIALELEEAQMKQIILHTEYYLAKSTEDNPTITLYHQQFLTNNNIECHDIHPQLLQRLPQAAPSLHPSTNAAKPEMPQPQHPSAKRSKKRKRPSQKSSQKRRKVNPALEPTISTSVPTHHQHFLDQRWTQNTCS